MDLHPLYLLQTASFACGIIFRNCDADCILCIFENLSMVSALHVEFIGAMRAIDMAFQRNWINFWLELDSILVVMGILQ